ncbi:branched-chain amino acid ABC transporter permease [Halococcus sp. AFM35]|uniref:branched-chain amino acid ABC transporter permease n=1 Tax=Halococcus sp. AFM35 TaxID=3421653 RepID=UPI003EBEF0FE
MSDEGASAGEGKTFGSVAQQVRNRWSAVISGEATVVLLTVVGVVLFPYLFVRAPVIGDVLNGTQSLAGLILIWGIFALGFDLLLGRTGLLSFGHAALWGAGAYGAGWVIVNVTAAPLVALVVGTVLAIVLSWLIGWLSLRRGGIYFAILTLAFGQMIYYTALGPAAGITGGDNGLTGVDPGPLLGTFTLDSELPSMAGTLLGNWIYVLVATVLVLSVVAVLRILNSPYGTVFRAIRENEQRAEFVGLNTWRYKLMAFVLSGTFAGVAGALFAIHSQYVPLSSLYWETSGEVVIMTVLGGVGTLFGPIFGAGLYLYVEIIVGNGHPFDWLVPYWHLVLGIVFVAVVVLLPEGIWGGVRTLREWVGTRLRGER